MGAAGQGATKVEKHKDVFVDEQLAKSKRRRIRLVRPEAMQKNVVNRNGDISPDSVPVNSVKPSVEQLEGIKAVPG